MKQFIQQLFKDKTNSYSMRELVIAVLLTAMLISWIGAQFFNHTVPEAIFYSFASLIASGCFGYSFEKKTSDPAITDVGITATTTATITDTPNP